MNNTSQLHLVGATPSDRSDGANNIGIGTLYDEYGNEQLMITGFEVADKDTD